ncbi:MAG: hypothetical protein JNG86_17445 [Verrucomicrobiaceae bacterium]|nr:hypothetical protein [Verrucomicrobiaceae bacterium]
MKLVRSLFSLFYCMVALGALKSPCLRAEASAGRAQQMNSHEQTPKGLSTSDWSSIRAAYEAGQHAFAPTAGGWQARNPGQQLHTVMDERGFTATASGADWQWGLELTGFGWAGQEQPPGGTKVGAEGQRFTRTWEGGLEEWYVNGSAGIEHGFTVPARPAGANGGMLSFVLAVHGGLWTELEPGGQAVRFHEPGGGVALTYAGLKVWDAEGKVLPARMAAASGGTVRIEVEEAGACYPLTVDPTVQQAYLKAHQVTAGDNFGYAVAVSGDTVVVGAYNEDSSTTGVNSTPDESASGSGAAYVFVRSGGSWTQQAYLKAHQVNASDRFGWSVAVSGNTVVVGATQEDSSTTGVNSTPNESASSAGAAYVFVRSGGVWTQQAYLKAHQVTGGDIFGWSVSVLGGTVVVGAINEDSSTTGVDSSPNESALNVGAAYVFVRNGTNWTQQGYLKAHQVNGGDQFGYSVAVSGDTVVVGTPSEDSSTTGVNSTRNESASGAGAAYVFVRSGGVWTQQAYLKAHQVNLDDQFGYSVAVSGDTVVVGARGEASSTTGINSTPNESASGAGAAYVFVRNGATWTQQAYLKAHQVNVDDHFGYSVSVADDTVAVGAWQEDSSTTGGNTRPNENAKDAGAAYVFVRSGTNWMQQAYLKAHQVNDDDWFGRSVSVSGDTVIVGADNEDSNTTGNNSTPNESASGAGATYVFTGLGLHSRDYRVRLVFDDPPPFAIEHPSFLQQVLGAPNEDFLCIQDSVLSNLEPAAALASAAERHQLATNLRAIYARSNLSNIQVEVGTHDPEAFNLHVVRENAATTGLGLAEDYGRFNRPGKGNAYILWNPSSMSLTSNQRAIMAAHEVGHLMGLPHVAAGAMTGHAEIMTYDWILGSSKSLPGMFSDSALNLCLRPTFDAGCNSPGVSTVNCQYHLRRYVGQKSDAELAEAGVFPGTYDLETPEMCVVEALEAELQALEAYGANRLNICGITDSSLHEGATVLRTLATWTPASGGGLRVLVERNAKIVVLGETRHGANVVFAKNGAPASIEDVTFEAGTAGQTNAVALAVQGDSNTVVDHLTVTVSEAVILAPNVEISAESLNGMVVFRAENGRTYTVQQSSNLQTWTVLATYAGDGRFINLPVPKAGFYRIVVAP